MKANFLKASFLVFVTIFTISCSKDDSSSSTETSGSSSSTTSTWAKFTVITPAGVVKPTYIVMMFDQPFSPTATMPTIIKQVTTDVNGLANFDLNTIVTSSVSKKYYFEAFVQSGTSYVLKTNYSRFDSDFVKGLHLTTSLLVN
jgi:hypothetical protein